MAPHVNRQAGVALVTVMLIIVILTAIVSRLSILNQIWMRQVDNSSALVQAGQATRAAQIWVASILEEDKNDYDGFTDDWAQPMIPIPVAWGEMYGVIEDMQSRFNLNNLIDNEGNTNELAYQQLRKLLELLELDPGIADAVVDWIDADSFITGRQGAEDIYYLGLPRPYMAANRPYRDEAELRLVRGIDLKTWKRLEPFISALPEETSININTASAELIAAMLSGPAAPANLKAEAERWVEDAALNPYPNLEVFAEQVSKSLNIKLPEGLGVSSSYFRANTQMAFASVQHRMLTLYQRKGGNARILQHRRTLF